MIYWDWLAGNSTMPGPVYHSKAGLLEIRQNSFSAFRLISNLQLTNLYLTTSTHCPFINAVIELLYIASQYVAGK